MKSLMFVTTLSGALLVGATAFAAPGQHPNLKAAERLLRQADEHISAAQRANEFDMGGHAAHAKDLIRQAMQEVAQASAATR
ncbi:MAG TPA: hypothetical protein VMB50_11980 [Myxococcales bacterium]|nr:hypothetical protein [Myxococcales bacterium]